MAASNRFSYSLACLGVSVLLLTSCLPGDDDLARESEFNQRTQINNTVYSLYQTANSMAGYLSGESRRRKAPLSETPITELATIEKNVEPNAPEGVKVVKCESGMLGAMVYFTQNPKGIPPLAISGSAMARKLAERHDERYVGWYENGRITLPKLAEENGCTDTNGIVEGSPIFLAGFAYGGDDGNPIVLPDTRKVTWPTVGKAVTLPCPSGFSGRITRNQDCRLITDEQGGEAEDVTFRTGVIDMGDVQDPGYELKAVRKNKTWECDQSQDASAPPTADEIMKFCRNDADNMEKPDDNVITMSAESMKQILEGSGPGYYTYSCRQKADGSNNCDAAPYTPTLPETTLRCDRNPVPERYVINPRLPVEVDDAGNVISETPGAAATGEITGTRDCGNGWTGDLIAGYEVRACQLVKTVDGVETPIKKAQTIYKIGYVGARCKSPPIEGAYNCPYPLGGQMVLREEHHMTKPLALQLRTAARGEWSPSAIPYTGNISPEAADRANNQRYTISNVDLAGMANPDFTRYLQGAMGADMQKDITGCKLAEQTCEFLPDPIRLGIIFDRSSSMTWDTLNSVSQRMECRAEIRDIFSNPGIACLLLRMGSGAGFLERFLKDRSNPIIRNALIEAINSGRTCDEMTTDKVGYCTPGRGTNQSTCPGTCQTVNVDLQNQSRLVIAEEQLLTAVGFIPPGSEFRYTEYIDDGQITSQQFPQFCDPMEDDTCDFGQELAVVKAEVMKNKGVTGVNTPLLQSMTRALEQFGDPSTGSDTSGILILFTDGQETDDGGWERRDFPYPYGGTCQDRTPSTNITDGSAWQNVCRNIGVTEDGGGEDEDTVRADLQYLYQTNNCSSDISPDENPLGGGTTYLSEACKNISYLYDGLANALTDQWDDCKQVGNTSRPSVVRHIQEKFPNLRVFMLDMGSALNACPSDQNGQIVKIAISDRDAFELAFDRAFRSLNTREATPEFVCQRVRDRLYSTAVNY